VQRTAQRIELEFEHATLVLVRHCLHRRLLPLLFIIEAHVHRRSVRIEPVGGGTNREIAVATYDGIARDHCDSAHRHRLARHLGPEQQMSAAETPMPWRDGHEQRKRHHCDRCNGAGNDQPLFGNDIVDRRSGRQRCSIFSEQIRERRGALGGLATADVEIRFDAATLVRQPSFEFLRSVFEPEPAQRPPQQGSDAADREHRQQYPPRPRNIVLISR
jgi:hypothetical protein